MNQSEIADKISSKKSGFYSAVKKEEVSNFIGEGNNFLKP